MDDDLRETIQTICLLVWQMISILFFAIARWGLLTRYPLFSPASLTVATFLVGYLFPLTAVSFIGGRKEWDVGSLTPRERVTIAACQLCSQVVHVGLLLFALALPDFMHGHWLRGVLEVLAIIPTLLYHFGDWFDRRRRKVAKLIGAKARALRDKLVESMPEPRMAPGHA